MSGKEHHGGGESSLGFFLLWIFGGMFEFINSLGNILGLDAKHH